MNINNSTFIEYISRNDILNIMCFIEKFEYEDFLNVNIYDVNIKCIKLEVKLFDSSNDGHNIKYIFIYKIY